MKAPSILLMANLFLIASALTVQAAHDKEGPQYIIKVSKTSSLTALNSIKKIKNNQKNPEVEEKEAPGKDCNFWTC